MDNFSEKKVFIAHWLIWYPAEWDILKKQLTEKWYQVFVPDLHELGYGKKTETARGITMDNIIEWLSDYISEQITQDNIYNKDISLALVGNSMGTYVIEAILHKNPNWRSLLTHYVSVGGSWLWVEHGNPHFNKFMVKLTGDPNAKWLPVITNAIARLMEYQNIKEMLLLKNDWKVLAHFMDIYYRIRGITIQDIRMNMLRFGISHAINIPKKYIDDTFVEHVFDRLWSFDHDKKWKSNSNIGIIATWLPRDKINAKKDPFFITKSVLQDLWKDPDVKIKIVWSHTDPMVLSSKFEEMGVLTGVQPIRFEHWWHAPQHSSQADEFYTDTIAFLDS